MTHHPTGTIAFLFTDIEGSTVLWESHPEQMRFAVARHDAILRQIIAEHTGYLFKATGDGSSSAFETASAAVAAAIAAQRALRSEVWPAPISLAIRMGIHTGSAEARDGDYFGPTLNRAARLTSAGHGGQTLISEATHELCRDALPPGVSLRNLGAQRLKDLTRAETIYQLRHPDLNDSFPPLRTLDNPSLPNNLPQQLTSFVGRESAITDVRNLLRNVRLLTLTGSGGSGKTRLSLQVAADLLDEFPDGAWQVEFAALTDPALVPQTTRSALGFPEKAGQSAADSLIENLKDKRLLLLLDNAEHLILACANLASAILRSCAGVKILVTSREALGVTGEQVYRVPSLSLPSAKQATSATPVSLNQFEAVRLFIDRARLVRGDFEVTNANAPALAQLCFRLDGIPLAIELAAARIRSLAVEDINVRLDHRFRLLTGGDRSALPRQQTLRALVDWSYDLLTESEKLLLARLSVFAAGWTIDAAEFVCGFAPIEDWEVLELLTSLVDKSLVVDDLISGAHRYRMLETLRQYAVERSDTGGEAQITGRRHREYFFGLVEALDPRLAGPEQLSLLNQLESEHDNLRAVLAFCDANSEGDNMQIALNLCANLSRFWWLRGYMTEGREHLDRVLKQADASHSASSIVDRAGNSIFLLAKAKALNGAGSLACSQGDYSAARDLNEQALLIQREFGAADGIARSLFNLGNIASKQSDHAVACQLYRDSTELYRQLADKTGVAAALNGLGNSTWGLGDLQGAREFYEESLVLQREAGNRGGIASTLNNLGIIAALRNEVAAAQQLFEQSVAIQRELGNKAFIANSVQNLGQFVSSQGDLTRGRSLLEESIALRSELGDKLGIALCLAGLASIAQGESNIALAVTLWAASASLREVLKAPLVPADTAEHDAELAGMRAQLGDAAYAAAWAEGRALAISDAVALALGGGHETRAHETLAR